MFATVVALLCSLAQPTSCYEKIVTNTEMNQDVTFISCALIGTREVSSWFANEGYHARGWQLSAVRCIAGHYVPKVPA